MAAVVAVAVVAAVGAGVVAWRVTVAPRRGPLPPAATPADVLTGLPARLQPPAQVVDLPPGETTGSFFSLWHAGGSPPSIWVEVGRPDLLPTSMPEGMPVIPAVALLGVDVVSGAALARIDTSTTGTGWWSQRCRGVVAEGVVLHRTTATSSELVVVSSRTGLRRVVTTLPRLATVLLPGTRY